MSEAEVLRGIVDGLQAAFKVRQVVLFGSRARHDARSDSDFDILAVVETDVPYRRRQGVARAAVEDSVDVDLDLIVLTADELATAQQRFGSPARRALEEGVVLFAALERSAVAGPSSG